MDVIWWVREVARLRNDLKHAEQKLTEARRVPDIRAEHERVAKERESWVWIPLDSAMLDANGNWTEKV
jgi:hypothetical protein